MPVVFKKQEPQKITIEKDGTKFFFEVNEARRRQARINMFLDKEHDMGKMTVDFFKTTLVGWQNLIDEDKKEMPFSIAVRDALVEETKIFSDDDVFEVVFGEDTPKKKKPKRRSTSKSASPKQ